MESRGWKAIKTSRSGPKVSYLSFADDLLFFAEAGMNQVRCIKEGLEGFCNNSGQYINFTKSLLFVSLNIAEQEMKQLSKEFGVPLTKDLGSYLGHQLVHQGSNHKLHSRLPGRMRGQLEGWKTKSLLRVGRITLAKIAHNTVPVFYMQLERLPVKIRKEVDKLVRKCVWGS